MINNRQGGRRRGRGGQRGQNPGGQPGNRQDNRQRGNAAQLLEKYKNMARDAQLAGDRVQTEYYLQYADHYFRVLSDGRPRFEEQRRGRDDEMDEDEGDEELAEAGEDQGGEGDEPRDRPERAERPERDRSERPDRSERNAGRYRERRPPEYAGGRDESDDGGGRPERTNGNGETIPFDVLPPAIGRDEGEEEAAEAKRPRRRVKTPRPVDGDAEGDVAPAA